VDPTPEDLEAGKYEIAGFEEKRYESVLAAKKKMKLKKQQLFANRGSSSVVPKTTDLNKQSETTLPQI